MRFPRGLATLVAVLWALALVTPARSLPPEPYSSIPPPQKIVKGHVLRPLPVYPSYPGGAAPSVLTVPALHVRAPIVGISAYGGVLTPPSSPSTMGWWQDGVGAGAPTGALLVTGHAWRSGDAPLNELEVLPVGAKLRLDTARGPVFYKAQSVRVMGKSELARRSTEIFSQDGRHRLVLMTCEGWNGYEYTQNVVVVARALPLPLS